MTDYEQQEINQTVSDINRSIGQLRDIGLEVIPVGSMAILNSVYARTTINFTGEDTND